LLAARPGVAAVSTDSTAGARVCAALCGAGAVPRCDRNAGRRCAFRPPGRYGRRLSDAAILARRSDADPPLALALATGRARREGRCRRAPRRAVGADPSWIACVANEPATAPV